MIVLIVLIVLGDVAVVVKSEGVRVLDVGSSRSIRRSGDCCCLQLYGKAYPPRIS
jgi:hypothetical protein